jgi:cytochrome P450
MFAMTEDDALSIIRLAIFSPEGRADPYPHLRRLADCGDWTEGDGILGYVYSYAAVAEFVRSRAFIKGTGQPPSFALLNAKQQQAVLSEQGEQSIPLVHLNPPDHTRIRRLVQPQFGPGAVEAYRIAAQALVDRLLDRLDPTRPIDLVKDIGEVFPAEMIGELVGLPAGERELVGELAARQVAAFDPGTPLQGHLSAARAMRQHSEYIRAVIRDRKQAPRNDLVTALITAEAEGDRLGEAELVSLLQTIYIGGYQTTTHTIGNGLMLLLRHPRQLEALARDPSLAPGAVREILRYDTTVGGVFAIAAEDTVLAGRRVQAGTRLQSMINAANHDSRAYRQPEIFDIHRRGQPLLSFGGGIHYCLGVHLALLELEVVFATLARRFPRMRLVDTAPQRADSVWFRHYASIPLLLEPTVSRGPTPLEQGAAS